MKAIKRIVVCIDFSVYSSEILEYAAGVAERNSAEIVAVNVINKRQIESIKEAINNEQLRTRVLSDFINDQTEKRIKNMDDLFNQWVPKQVSTKIIIKSGVPFEEILRVVDGENADLLVISSKGRTNFEDYMFGTTAEKVFRHCPVPILSLNVKK
ncbi:MAG: universal stress protein [Desulfobulbaceae bacterium]|nr:universal stress protein [Desulfobulbaceae bacterium]